MIGMIRLSIPYLTSEEGEAVNRVLRSGYIAYGDEARRLEEEFAEYIGVKHAITVANGTLGLFAALLSLDIGPGDEVITSGFSFIASSNAALYVGAKPVFADIDPRTFNIDPEDVLEKITGKTKAIIAVHLYGQPCEMDALAEIAEDHNLFLIEDACQAHGAEYRGRKSGSIGDVGVFSFYATKNMTTGEGGIITTNDDGIASRLRMIIDHGQEGKYNHVILGYNFRMSNILAAIGRVQLKRLDELNRIRIRNAEYYDSRLSRIGPVTTPYKPRHVKHVYHQYVIKAEDRDGLREYLFERGVETAIHYPKPIYRQPLYLGIGYGGMRLENCEEASRMVLSIPIHPYLTLRDLDRVIEAISGYYGGE